MLQSLVNQRFEALLITAADRNRRIHQAKKHCKKEVSAHLLKSVIKSVINIFSPFIL